MPKTEDIIRYLPDIYGASEKETLLFKVIDAFGKRLQEIEDNLIEIMRTHWVDHAATMDDLTRLGAFYDIRPREGRVTHEEHTYEEGKDTYDLKRVDVRRVEQVDGPLTGTEHIFEEEDYTVCDSKLKWVECKARPDDRTKFYVDYYWIEELGAYRKRLKETVKTYLSGVGTVQTVKDIVTATLDLPTASEDSGKENSLKLIEFPPRMIKSEQQVTFMSQWEEETRGFGPTGEESKPTIRITGIDEKTVNPIITNMTTGTQVWFEGIVPEGKVLTITPEGMATLDGNDVSERVHLRKGVFFNQTYFDESNFAIYDKGKLALPRGISTWKYSTESATFADGGEYPFSRFDSAIFELSPSVAYDQRAAIVELIWEEQQPATFIISIPWRFKKSDGSIAGEQDVAARHEVKTVVDRVRAAGIRAIIDYFEEVSAERHRQKEQLSFFLQSLLDEKHNQQDDLSVSLESLLTERMGQQGRLSMALRSAFMERLEQQEHLSLNLNPLLFEQNTQVEMTWFRSEKSFAEQQAASDELGFVGVYNMNSFDNRSLFA